MHIISERVLREFWKLHPDAESPLRAWHRNVEHAEWKRPDEVRAVYRDVDQVGKFTVFNIGGNKYRLIAVIHYNCNRIYIRHVLTHREYDRGAWKEQASDQDRPEHGKKPTPKRRRRSS